MEKIISLLTSLPGTLGAVKGILGIVTSIVGFLIIRKAIKGFMINQSKIANEQKKVDQQNDLDKETQEKGDQYTKAQDEVRKSLDG